MKEKATERIEELNQQIVDGGGEALPDVLREMIPALEI